MNKTEKTREFKREMTHHKHRIIGLMNRYEGQVLQSEMDRLSAIIGRLEHWQNSGADQR